MDLKKREEILNFLLAAGVDVTSDITILFSIPFIQSIEMNEDEIASVFDFIKEMGLYKPECFSEKEASGLQENKPKENLELFVFLTNITPYQVSLFREIQNRIPGIANKKILFLAIGFNLCKHEREHGIVADSAEWYKSKANSFAKKWETIYKKTEEEFIDIYDHFLQYSLKPIPVLAKGRLRKVADTYKKFFVPNEKLFHDYCSVNKISGEPFNPWYNLKNNQNIHVRQGVSVDETIINDGAWQIREQKPTDIIRYLFYPTYKNDSAFECGFLLSSFVMESDKNSVLIYYPSPDMIISSVNKIPSERIRFIVQDEYFINAYKREFPSNIFSTPETMAESKATNILAIFQDSIKISFKEAIEIIGNNRYIQRATILVPNCVMDHQLSSTIQSISNAGFSVDRILILDTSITNSKPRKKSLLYLGRSGGSRNYLTTLYHAGYDEKEKKLFIDDKHYQSNLENVVPGMTLLGLWKNYNQEDRNDSLIKARKRSVSYAFSKEINIRYSYTVRNGIKSGIASYYSHPFNGAEKKITPSIEKGLRGAEETQFFGKLEQIPFYENVDYIIRRDIKKAYENISHELSLKSLWFIQRRELQSQDKYNEDIAKEILCRNHKIIEEMTYKEFDKEQLSKAISQITENFTQEKKQRYWDQIYLVYKQSVTSNYLPMNPILDVYQNLSNKLLKEQQEVRNALTKKQLSINEQIKLLTKRGGVSSPDWDNTSSIKTIIIAFRLFTAIPAKEMCALKWEDVVYIAEYGIYQVQITKYTNEQEQIVLYGAKEDWLRFRCIPIVPALAGILLARKKYIQNKYRIKDENIDRIPIFCETIDKRKNRQKAMPIWKINQICRDGINNLGIKEMTITLPEDDKETDLNKYRNDLFVSNFKFCGNHISKMTRGEINYLLGLTAPDTYSKHYCDYTNDAIQFSICKKIERWVSLLRFDEKEEQSAIKSMTRIKAGPYILSASINICIKIKKASKITISVNSEYGCKGTMILSDEKEVTTDD